MAFADLVAATDRATRDHLGGGPVTYAPVVGSPVVVDGIFDRNFTLDSQGGDSQVELRGPAVFLVLDDLPTDPEADDPIITVGAEEYRVRARRKDSHGGIVLMLHRSDV